MRAIATLVAVLSLIVLSESKNMHVLPVFVWSGKSLAPVAEPTSVDVALANSLVGSPEIVVFYMLNEVSALQLRKEKSLLKNIEASITSAATSTFKALPLTKVQISDLASASAEKGANIIEVDSSAIQAYLAEHREVLANGKTDVVFVRFSAGATLDAIDAVVGACEKAVSGTEKRRSILSTSSSMAETTVANLLQFQAADRLWTKYPTLSASFANDVSWSDSGVDDTRRFIKYGTSAYMTPTLLLAILVMIYVLILALSAFCCLLSLQTPEKFEGDQKLEMERELNRGSGHN